MLWTVTFHFEFFTREVLSHSFVSHMWSDVRLSEPSACAILPSRTLGHNTLLLMTVARIKACDVSAGVLHWWEFGSWSRAWGPTGKQGPVSVVFYTSISLWFEAQNPTSQSDLENTVECLSSCATKGKCKSNNLFFCSVWEKQLFLDRFRRDL